MTKHLDVPFLSHLNSNSHVDQVSATLDSMESFPIDNAPWLEYNYVPEVFFSIAHGSNCIFIKYYIAERVVRGACYESNGPVYEDSCVEFFVALNRESQYYNFEFNVLGTCKLNYGENRFNRKVIPDEIVEKIRYSVSIQNQKGEDGKRAIHWDITLIIPLEAFAEHELSSIAGQQCAANFHKCGDQLPQPHFLCWNKIESNKPDFHLRQFFGELTFL
jgi:hypothetical protein